MNEDPKRTYYPDGTLMAENATFDEKRRRNRIWHPNGVLAEERLFTPGCADEMGRQWSTDGRLLGEYEIKNGTGVLKRWHDNGSIQFEMSIVNGMQNGRQRVIDDEGEVMDEYYINNRRVSKKKYLEACAKDPTLPRYDDLESPSPQPKPKRTKSRKKGKAASPDVAARDKTIEQMLGTPQCRDALAWLLDGVEGSHSIGEDEDPEEVIEFVRALHADGATAVTVVDVQDYGDGMENAGKMVVTLPTDPSQRTAIFERCQPIAEKTGHDPEPDEGQKYLFLMFD